MKVAVGISGGVDSAVAAAFLKEQGYKVTGVFLECWNEPGCRTDEDRKDALAVALKLKIPFKVLDFKREYKQKVLDIFYREYKKGRTPNPDILCNQEIKFGMFLEWSLKNKFDYVATGHYAQVKFGSAYEILSCSRQRRAGTPEVSARKFTLTASTHLLRSVDEKKDQTYFLAMLKEEQLSRVMFPIGHLTKKQVRQEAKKRGLGVWNKKDSTGICFIGHDLNFRDFLKRKIKEHEGEVVRRLKINDKRLTNDEKNKYLVIGKHQGFEFYTIGQRFARPWFVIQKDIKRNRLIVGKKQDLAKKELEVEIWSWINKDVRDLINDERLECRIRHQGRLIPCKIIGKKVKLAKSEYGIAPGQMAVIYHGHECLGGGIIN
ncbi:MAG: tRNA 2-thiouridine(34) synthase MnmA [Candidatus Beckwithbacteria bacterium]|nr:tRNA 2-thiouridine(34) synthase MnmA [Candidatus Beckwithbacteria bacterium]